MSGLPSPWMRMPLNVFDRSPNGRYSGQIGKILRDHQPSDNEESYSSQSIKRSYFSVFRCYSSASWSESCSLAAMLRSTHSRKSGFVKRLSDESREVVNETEYYFVPLRWVVYLVFGVFGDRVVLNLIEEKPFSEVLGRFDCCVRAECASEGIQHTEWDWKWKDTSSFNDYSPTLLLKMSDYEESTMMTRNPIRRLPSSDVILRSFLLTPSAHTFAKH